ncbi:MAG: DUF1688 family protein, partial [Myxococcales bacterium]|nr:DUF1688 family protein [Myxococcales bacterium]
MSHPGPTDDERAAITYLRSPLAVRARCENVLARGLDGGLTHFAVDLDQIAAAAAEVAAVTRERYPTLQVPGHGRMNQLGAGDVDRVADLAAQMAGLPRMERARALVDLVLISVVLDTRAGDAWRYHEAATGQTLTGSEGLAVATLHAFAAGLFSAEKREPWRVDARRLVELDDGDLAAALQVGPDNPLVGLAGRAQLLRRLGSALRGSTWFPGARPGSLIDSLGALSRDGAVAAAELLGALLDGLGDVWPGAIALGGVPLGD